MAEEQKILVHIDHYTGERPIRVIYREDEAVSYPKPLEFKEPQPINLVGTIDAPLEFVKRRGFDVSNSHLEVDRDAASITLVVNESDIREAIGSDIMEKDYYVDYCGHNFLPKSTITGCIDYSDEFLRLGINNDSIKWSPLKLAKYLRLNRHLFADKETGALFIAKLKKVTATITGKFEKAQENGSKVSKTDYFNQEVEHNIDTQIDLKLSIFKGGEKANYTVEVDVDYINNEFELSLVSPAMCEANEEARDKELDRVVSEIIKLQPNLLVINK